KPPRSSSDAGLLVLVDRTGSWHSDGGMEGRGLAVNHDRNLTQAFLDFSIWAGREIPNPVHVASEIARAMHAVMALQLRRVVLRNLDMVLAQICLDLRLRPCFEGQHIFDSIDHDPIATMRIGMLLIIALTANDLFDTEELHCLIERLPNRAAATVVGALDERTGGLHELAAEDGCVDRHHVRRVSVLLNFPGNLSPEDEEVRN